MESERTTSSPMVALSDQLIKTHGLYTSFIHEPIMTHRHRQRSQAGPAQVIETAAREPVVIQRQKRDVAVVLSMREYERLTRLNVAEFQRFATVWGSSHGRPG